MQYINFEDHKDHTKFIQLNGYYAYLFCVITLSGEELRSNGYIHR